MRISVERKVRALDNTSVEQPWRSVKREDICHKRCQNMEEAWSRLLAASDSIVTSDLSRSPGTGCRRRSITQVATTRGNMKAAIIVPELTSIVNLTMSGFDGEIGFMISRPALFNDPGNGDDNILPCKLHQR